MSYSTTGEFLVHVPLFFRPTLKAFMIRMQKITGKKMSMRDTFCLILAKGIGAPWLYEDMVRYRDEARALKKDNTKKRQQAKKEKEKAKKAALRAKRAEAKAERDAKKRMLEGEATLEELLTKAGMDIERYEKGVLPPSVATVKPKRKRRTKAEMEQARKQKARAKAMKAQPETFFMDVPK
jgi:hypothetical protein